MVHVSVGQSAKTWLPQLCLDTGCNLEDLPGMDGEKETGNSGLSQQLDDDDNGIFKELK